MDEQDEEKSNPILPEKLEALLLLIIRNVFCAAVVVTLLVLAWWRTDFFPGSDLIPPAAVERLPLPEEKLRTPATAFAALNPHESFFVVKIKKAPAGKKTEPVRDLEALKKAPITGKIPGAYLVVYLSRRAVGLVVNGQYVRTYYHAALPADLTARAGADGRAPVGDYFVVSHDTQRGVQKLRLNYPSPADAAKMLAAGKISKAEYQGIADAAKAKKLPARLNPVFGAAAYISGDGIPDGTTRGDIAVTAKEMRELWTALADGAAVMIRP